MGETVAIEAMLWLISSELTVDIWSGSSSKYVFYLNLMNYILFQAIQATIRGDFTR